jgi:hypothetical protein
VVERKGVAALRTGWELRSCRPAFLPWQQDAGESIAPTPLACKRGLATIGNHSLVTIALLAINNSVGICTQSGYIRRIS